MEGLQIALIQSYRDIYIFYLPDSMNQARLRSYSRTDCLRFTDSNSVDRCIYAAKNQRKQMMIEPQ
jgi:hypothetical protein